MKLPKKPSSTNPEQTDNKCRPNTNFLQEFCFAFSKKHWSNETKTIFLISDVLAP